MKAVERGVMLLCCRLADPDAKPMTLAQFRELSRRANTLGASADDTLRAVKEADIMRLGYDAEQAERIVGLLNREDLLDQYLSGMEHAGITALTRISERYPAVLAKKLGLSCPPVLFAKGDLSLLRYRAVSVVGSRRLMPEGADFARTAGRLIAQEGFALCSGGAEGADSIARQATLQNGGYAVIYTPLELWKCRPEERTLYLSEDGFELPFTAQRALSRNRLIHATGEKVLVAQVRNGVGGTWSGTAENLRRGYSPVFVHDDGSEGAQALMARGASGVRELTSVSALESSQLHF